MHCRISGRFWNRVEGLSQRLWNIREKRNKVLEEHVRSDIRTPFLWRLISNT